MRPGAAVVWPIGFRVVAIASTLTATFVLLNDARSARYRYVLIAAVLVELVLGAITLLVDGSVADGASVVAACAVAAIAYPIGGLVYLAIAFLHVIAGTITSWPPLVRSCVRSATLVLTLLAFASVGGAALFASPLLVPLLMWSFFDVNRWFRFVYGALVAVYIATLVSVGVALLSGKTVM
jgi:hypothetical protein